MRRHSDALHGVVLSTRNAVNFEESTALNRIMFDFISAVDRRRRG